MFDVKLCLLDVRSYIHEFSSTWLPKQDHNNYRSGHINPERDALLDLNPRKNFGQLGSAKKGRNAFVLRKSHPSGYTTPSGQP